MTYYVTGANGFIGQHVCEYLKGQDIRKIKHSHCPFTFEKDSVVIHLAAYGNHSTQRSITDMIASNIKTLYFMLDAFRLSEAKVFYNFSTSSVTLKHQTLYSASKLMGEQIVNSYNDPRMVNIRPYSVYGPGEAANRFIPTVIRCLKTGEQMNLDCDATHDWIYVTDVIRLMFEGKTDLGTGTKFTNMQVVRMLEQISGKELNYNPVKNIRPYDNDDWVCPSINKALSLFEGLKLTYEQTA